MISMRDLIDLVQVGILTEGANDLVDRLYHGTSLWGLIGILQSDSMAGNDGDDAEYGASLTRSLRVAQGFTKRGQEHADYVSINLKRDPKMAEYYQTKFPLEWGEYAVDPENLSGAGGAILVFDRRKLKDKFGRALVPVAAGANGFRGEAEERLLGAPIGILSCLVSIKIMDPTKFKKYQKIVLRLDPSYKDEFAMAKRLSIQP